MTASESPLHHRGRGARPRRPPRMASAGLQFPSAVTTLAIVTVLVWLVALFLPSGQLRVRCGRFTDPGHLPGGAVAAELRRVGRAAGAVADQRHLRPAEPRDRGRRHRDHRADVRPDRRHRVHHGDRRVHLGVASRPAASRSPSRALANRLRSKGWLLIAAVMVLFSLLGSTMGFSVETFGFYALFIPLMAALGYDRHGHLGDDHPRRAHRGHGRHREPVLDRRRGRRGRRVDRRRHRAAADPVGAADVDVGGLGAALRRARSAATRRRHWSGWDDPDVDASATDHMAEDLEHEPVDAEHRHDRGPRSGCWRSRRRRSA